jgi:hypothetical protein
MAMKRVEAGHHELVCQKGLPNLRLQRRGVIHEAAVTADSGEIEAANEWRRELPGLS